MKHWKIQKVKKKQKQKTQQPSNTLSNKNSLSIFTQIVLMESSQKFYVRNKSPSFYGQRLSTWMNE